MKKNESIKNIMSQNLICATTNQKISDVKGLMEQHHINHVPVVSGKKLIGLISRTDILRSSYSDLFVKTDQPSIDQLDSVASIEDLMTRDIKTLKLSDTVRDAAMILMSATFNSLPIINDTEELVGIVTTKDMIRYLIEQY